jgi:hypothetical protein
MGRLQNKLEPALGRHEAGLLWQRKKREEGQGFVDSDDEQFGSLSTADD